MNPLAGLKDIQGLDAISWWPLAVGWWIVLAIFTVGMVGGAWVYVARERRRRHWQYQFLRRLEWMQKTATAEQTQAMATELADMMRRLAVFRYSRTECAHLHGRAWLEWLAKNDPSQFDWTKNSHILVEAPFRPPNSVTDLGAFRKTVEAAKGWAQRC